MFTAYAKGAEDAKLTLQDATLRGRAASSTGLLALLDDVAAIAKVAAASLDDVGTLTVKAGAKSAGVVIDDAAVTPRYVVGFAPARELPIVRRIAVGSLKNKLFFLLPAALILSVVAPWAITPLLMLGGAYLCYEGAEKVLEALFPHAAHAHEAEIGAAPADPVALENAKVASAIRTDFILSAEIMAIALATLPDVGFATRAVVLALVGTLITIGVYGAVAVIVKADDVGLALARGGRTGLARAAGRGLVRGMPGFLKGLTVVGTVAMLWVGGDILVHGFAVLGWHAPEHLVYAVTHAVADGLPLGSAAVDWITGAAVAGLFGIASGAALVPLVGKVLAPAWKTVRGGG